MSNSLIFDIKRYAINDGPGIRLTIFFKGCPLSCVWCHNPESISPQTQKMYSKQKCIGAQKCIEVCPNDALQLTPDGVITDWDKCAVCGKCAEVCPTKAIEISGEQMDINQLLKTIESESLFFDQSGGGVTFSGGEPLMHYKTLLELLEKCGQRHIHRVVDTSLFSRSEIVKQVAEKTELFLVDLKHMDDEKHKKYTGVSNQLILKNIQLLSDLGSDFWIRIPLIEGINADEENIKASAEFLSKLKWPSKLVNLLPYHDIGKNKHLKLGSTYDGEGMHEPSAELIERCIQIFKNNGIEAIVGG
ncbi:glycyl-radical enzyme activating protein [Carboxylicivirga linearis]|uniref:Glycyl-radical enzyme activating protein n=1 Tax=Carboxylicivirga linearis TaxID=1628157 RepID=A0ABS5K0E7_9BACT|nr:glycyl-radical enzyme activating protein [Carboxylicivirga linearis]MBS2100619.1 glycyl-radical enzyme activating protein [Carboxylicivirga linearis]